MREWELSLSKKWSLVERAELIEGIGAKLGEGIGAKLGKTVGAKL